MPDPDDPTIKELLAGRDLSDVVDEMTKRELEKWFGLPSFDELAEKGITPEPAPAEDPDLVAARERRDRAIAAVDPALLAHFDARDARTEKLIKFVPDLEVRVDPSVALFDTAMIARQIAEPREVAIPEELSDDMKEVTPQALLRDLHRPELTFDKTFEVVDVAAEQRLDVVAEVDAAMRASWKLPPLGASPWKEAAALIDAIRADERRSWVELAKTLPNRTVEE